MKKPFSLPVFIQESNKIDPQPDERGGVIPGMEPGDLLYDNQEAAFELAREFASLETVSDSIALDLHRALTRNVPYFEERGQSGVYRRRQVWIGGEQAPAAAIVPSLMHHIWSYCTNQWLQAARSGEINPVEAAWSCHHLFEVIHPFIDGNGRTGRLLLNWFLVACNQEPVVVYYDKREDYYRSIQHFRNRVYPTLYHEFLIRMGDPSS
jgi:Fic family protein